MFGLSRANGDFDRDVSLELYYLTKLHGEEALAVARQKAARPSIRTARRKVLEAVVLRLEAPARPKRTGLLKRLLR